MSMVKGVRFESHIGELDEELEQKIYTWLEAIGMDAASTAQTKAPVDTGRLKNSIYPVVYKPERCVYVGTNVEYAAHQEFGTSRGVAGKHFIQFGATAHQKEYKKKLEDILKEE